MQAGRLFHDPDDSTQTKAGVDLGVVEIKQQYAMLQTKSIDDTIKNAVALERLTGYTVG